MGKIAQQTFSQGRHTAEQQADEKMLHIFIIREMEWKPQGSITSHLFEWLFSKRQEITGADEDAETREPSYTVGGFSLNLAEGWRQSIYSIFPKAEVWPCFITFIETIQTEMPNPKASSAMSLADN